VKSHNRRICAPKNTSAAGHHASSPHISLSVAAMVAMGQHLLTRLTRRRRRLTSFAQPHGKLLSSARPDSTILAQFGFTRQVLTLAVLGENVLFEHTRHDQIPATAKSNGHGVLCSPACSHSYAHLPQITSPTPPASPTRATQPPGATASSRAAAAATAAVGSRRPPGRRAPPPSRRVDGRRRRRHGRDHRLRAADM
jgi:hypothetical protein